MRFRSFLQSPAAVPRADADCCRRALHAVSANLPREKEGVVKQRVKLTFPQHLIKEPVIFTMAKQFDVIPNIRRARITDTVGEMILELEGTDEHVGKGLHWLREKGIEVELVEGDVIE